MSLQCVWGRRSGHRTAWHFLWQSPSFGVMEAYEVDRSSQVCKDAGSLHLSVTCQVTRVIYSFFPPIQWREGQTHTKAEPCPEVGQCAVNLTHKNNTKREKERVQTLDTCWLHLADHRLKADSMLLQEEEKRRCLPGGRGEKRGRWWFDRMFSGSMSLCLNEPYCRLGKDRRWFSPTSRL